MKQQPIQEEWEEAFDKRWKIAGSYPMGLYIAEQMKNFIRSELQKARKEMIEEISTKKRLIITHGDIEHSVEDKYDCMQCIEDEIEFLKDMKKAGGITKFEQKVLKELEKNSLP